MDERRRFERISLPEGAKVYCEDHQGKRLGAVRILGRGGLLLATKEHLGEGAIQHLTLVDEPDGIRRPVRAIVRYVRPDGVGLEFAGLDPEAAVEVGVIIGKYYSTRK